MALRVKVCRTDEVAPGDTKGFSVPGVTIPIMVTNIDGTSLAAAGVCPHEDVSLLSGKRKDTRVICPGHGYRFDMRTGACSHDPKLRLACYKVTIVESELYVDLM